MKNKFISYIEKKYINKKLPILKVGYYVEIKIWVFEGNKKRIQSFEGLIISKRNRGLNSSIVLRKISHNEGVERIFKIHSPIINDIIIKKKKFFKKSKLYYLRLKKKKLLSN